MDSRLFLPGSGAPAALYAPGLPATWHVPEPPGFAASGGSLGAYSRWLDLELRHRGDSLRHFVRQIVSGGYPRRVATAALLSLAERARALDLRRECAPTRAAGIPTTVIGCAADTLVTTDRTRALAEALGAHYEELDMRGGHMWMLADRARLAAAVSG
jgi:hypothetical protein